MANPQDIERELERFARGESVSDRLDALRALFTWNVPQARNLDPRMELGESFLLERAEVGDERLEATAALGRNVRAVRARSAALVKSLEKALTSPLPAMAGWADAEERLFVAHVLERVRPAWTLPYVADFLVRDEASAKAREVLSPLLVDLAGSVDSALVHLREAAVKSDLRAQDFERRARQLRLTLTALSSTMSLSVEVGGDAAIHLSDFVDLAMPRTDAGVERMVRIETARVVLGFLALLLRGSVSASFQPESYRALRAVRGWFAPARWPDELQVEVAAVVSRLSDALETLALRDSPDDGLFRILESTVGRDGALDATRGILRKRPGLPQTVHGWLQSGPGAQRAAPSESAGEASLRKADPAIALSMMAARALQAEAANTLEGATPDSAATVRLARLMHETIQSVRMVGAIRGLKLFGTSGETVEFDARLHRMAPQNARAAKVRIVQPAVIRQIGDAAPVVIQLAIVEPMPEGGE